MKLIALGTVALLALGSAAWAENAEKPEKGMRGKPPSFAEMDANKDGSVSLAEFTEAQQKQIERRFKNMDSNNDGKLSEGELSAARDRMEKRGPPPGEHEGHNQKAPPPAD